MSINGQASLVSKAMIAKISFSMIGMRKKDNVATNRANNLLQTSQAAGMYQKCRISRKNIIDVIRVKDQISRLHRNSTTPFTKDGWGLIAADLVMGYSTQMSDYKQQFYLAADDVQNRWPAIVADEQQRLGPLFNANEYPPQNKVKNYFRFTHELKPITDVESAFDHLVLSVEKEVIEDLKHEMRKEREKSIERSQKDMWDRLFEPVEKMADICLNDKKVFKSVITNLEHIIDIMPQLNIVDNTDLTNMADEIKAKLLSHTVGQIRDDKHLKKSLGTEAEQLVGKMKHYMGYIK